MKIHIVETELFHADRKTDGQTRMVKLIAALCNFSDVSKNDTSSLKK